MAWAWGRRRSEVRLLDRDDLLLTPEAVELGCRRIDGWDPKRARRAATLWRYGAIAWRAAKAKGTRKRKAEAPDQVLPLTRKQRQLVDAHLATLSAESHWLFPAPSDHSRPVSADRLTKLFRATAKAAMVYLDGERYGYHALRRAVRYRLHVAKVEKDDVAVLMGWSSGAAGLMAERYLRRASQPDVLWNLVHALDFEVTDSAAEQEQCFLPPEERAA
jgi:integrase